MQCFFGWRLLGLIPGGAPFSQLSSGVKDAMVVCTTSGTMQAGHRPLAYQSSKDRSLGRNTDTCNFSALVIAQGETLLILNTLCSDTLLQRRKRGQIPLNRQLYPIRFESLLTCGCCYLWCQLTLNCTIFLASAFCHCFKEHHSGLSKFRAQWAGNQTCRVPHNSNSWFSLKKMRRLMQLLNTWSPCISQITSKEKMGLVGYSKQNRKKLLDSWTSLYLTGTKAFDRNHSSLDAFLDCFNEINDLE